ncbi:MAG: cation diffusion facilitator family transporter [Polyangiaceae bacterium]
MSGGGSLKVIIGSFLANVGIAAAKWGAAFFTGSGAMMAEAIHSSADCMNQVLLLVGARQAQKPPDEIHPLGYGRSAYFWSFLVALMIFFGGGVLSINEGWEKTHHPEQPDHVWVAFVILGVSLVLEAAAAAQAAIEINKKRGGKVGFFEYLRLTTDVDLVVLFAENAAAVVGLFFAIGALALTVLTHNAAWDGYGCLVIGVLLTFVAWFLAREVKSLLDGERADPTIEEAIKIEASADARLGQVLRVITLQQGPSQVLVAAKLKVDPELKGGELITAINEFETRVRARCPEVKWQFIEPDFEA